jgi:hypothetical protein
MMWDKRTVEEKQAAAKACYESYRRLGRRSCSGCHLDYYCQMGKDSAKWLVEVFLPAIDPAGTLRG